jgi:hypothetical protein
VVKSQSAHGLCLFKWKTPKQTPGLLVSFVKHDWHLMLCVHSVHAQVYNENLATKPVKNSSRSGSEGLSLTSDVLLSINPWLDVSPCFLLRHTGLHDMSGRFASIDSAWLLVLRFSVYLGGTHTICDYLHIISKWGLFGSFVWLPNVLLDLSLLRLGRLLLSDLW